MQDRSKLDLVCWMPLFRPEQTRAIQTVQTNLTTRPSHRESALTNTETLRACWHLRSARSYRALFCELLALWMHSIGYGQRRSPLGTLGNEHDLPTAGPGAKNREKAYWCCPRTEHKKPGLKRGCCESGYAAGRPLARQECEADVQGSEPWCEVHS